MLTHRLCVTLGICMMMAVMGSESQAQVFPKGVKSIEAWIEPAEAKPGQDVTLSITVTLTPGHYTYPIRQADQQEKDSQTELELPGDSEIEFTPVADPSGAHTKPGAKGELQYYPGQVTWTIPGKVKATATNGEKTITLKAFRIIVCNEKNCYPPKKHEVKANVTITGSSATMVTKEPAPKVETPKTITSKDPPAPEKAVENSKKTSLKISPNGDYKADLFSTLEGVAPFAGGAGQSDKKDSGFLGFLITAAFWGFITLLTPCVFPMVPITVSVFLKQSEKTGSNPMVQAIVYALTIVLVLGISALTLLSVFRELSVNPYLNVALGALFVFFALSLFGMYDITLPNWIVNMTSSREGKGGILGTVFMGLTFSIISFTCVAPFLGGFAGIVASGQYNYFQLSLGAFTFAASFAAPFFLLALFPSLLKKLPRSGGWMNTIKVAMGFLEFAAAFKFFRTAELRWLNSTTIFTYDVVMASWIILLAVAGVYLLGMFRLPHDHDDRHHIGVLRMIWAIVFLGLSVYLFPAMISHQGERVRPTGTVYAWVDSFLLPEPSPEEGWSGDLKKSLEAARNRDEYVFVDFTGVTCTNCKLNEKNVFPKPAVAEQMRNYRLVQLYTDTIPENLYAGPVGRDKREADAEANLEFQRKYFLTEQLPLYVILKPERDGKVRIVNVYDEGKINNEADFVEFLRSGREK